MVDLVATSTVRDWLCTPEGVTHIHGVDPDWTTQDSGGINRGH